MKHYVLAAAVLALGISPALANTATGKAKVDSWFAKGDTDRDGYISREEHDSWANTMFDRADSNKDGMISKSEFAAQKARKQAARQQHRGGKGAMAPSAGSSSAPDNTSDNQNIKDTKPQ